MKKYINKAKNQSEPPSLNEKQPDVFLYRWLYDSEQLQDKLPPEVEAALDKPYEDEEANQVIANWMLTP